MIEHPCARPQKTAERELQIHREFAANLIALNNEEDLLWYVAESVVGRLGYLDCVIYRLDPANNILTQAAAIGEKTPFRRRSGTRCVYLLEMALPARLQQLENLC